MRSTPSCLHSSSDGPPSLRPDLFGALPYPEQHLALHREGDGLDDRPHRGLTWRVGESLSADEATTASQRFYRPLPCSAGWL